MKEKKAIKEEDKSEFIKDDMMPDHSGDTFNEGIKLITNPGIATGVDYLN